MEDNKPKIVPFWKQAIKDFLELNPHPGMQITHEWLCDKFGIQEATSVEEYKKASLNFLSQFQDFRESLLEDHMIDLKSITGIGYEVVHPKDQANLAFEKRTKKVAKELTKLNKSVSFVNVSALSDSERQEHTNNLSKAGVIKSMFNRRKLLGN